tara:strand:+ start:82 stop:375 length:294 start_codon:yes stop_codon:yes gene_type:complete
MNREQVTEYNEQALLCDGLDKALIGVAQRINLCVAAYDVNKIIQILKGQMYLDKEELELPLDEQDIRREEMSWEYFNFNIKGSWVGNNTPVFIYKSD